MKLTFHSHHFHFRHDNLWNPKTNLFNMFSCLDNRNKYSIYLAGYDLFSIHAICSTECNSVEAQGSWVCTFMYMWFDFRIWKTVIGRSRKIWFPCPKCGQFVRIPSEICWISKIFKTCQVTTHFKGNFMLIKNFIRNLCSKSKAKQL